MAVDPVLQSIVERADNTMVFHPADAFVMSCGTVTIDLQRGLILLIWNKKLQAYQLPKGRRNIDENMWSAALRETYEETGYLVRPLRLKIATRATPPAAEKTTDNPQITEGRISTEILGICIYPDPQSDAPALKMVFYYVATADSTATPAVGTQENHEKLEASWVPVAEAAAKLRFQGEKAVVLKALDDIRKTGYTIGG
ncbi:hypothetical protein OQA88_6334 [Cercophora sp. LCS_1]